MAKILKPLLYLAGLLLTVIVVAAVVLSVVVNEDNIKTQVIKLAKQQTGGTLVIDGDMSLSFYPELGVRLGDVSFTNAGDTKPLAQLNTLQLAVELMPLFGGNVNVSGVTLDGMQLALQVDENGQGNWEMQSAQAEQPTNETTANTSEPSSTPTGADTTSAEPPADMAIAIETISITNTSISYVDNSTGLEASLSDFSLTTTKANIDNTPFPLEMAFTAALNEPELTVTAAFNTTASISEGGTIATLQDFILEATVTGDATGGKPLPLNLQSNISANTTTGEYQVSELSLTANGVDVAALAGKASGKLADINLSSTISANTTSGEYLINGLHLNAKNIDVAALTDSPKAKPTDVDLVGNIAANTTNGQYQLSNIKLNAAGLAITTNINANQNGDAIKVTGPITIAEFNAKQLLTDLGQVPPVTANPKALTKVAVNGNLVYDGSRALLNQVAITLDNTNITGQVGLANIEQELMKLVVNIDDINADDYLPPVAEANTNTNTNKTTSTSSETKPAPTGNKTPNSSGSKTASAEEPLPLADLKTINAIVKANIGRLIINGLTTTNVVLDTRADKGLVTLNTFAADLYQGNINSSGVLNARPATATLKAKTNIKKISLKPLLHDASEMDWINGITNMNANITTKGNTITGWQNNLNGTANFAITQFLAEGISVDKQLCQGIALINGKKLTTQWGENTELDNLNGKMTFVNGVMRNDSLTGGSKTLKLTGKGWVNPQKNKMDYKMGILVAGDKINNDPACAVNERYRDITWPFECKGELDEEPSSLCGIDESEMKDIVADMAKDEVKRKAIDAINDKLKDKGLDGLLKGFF